jgi:hypothetical protein
VYELQNTDPIKLSRNSTSDTTTEKASDTQALPVPALVQTVSHDSPRAPYLHSSPGMRQPESWLFLTSPLEQGTCDPDAGTDQIAKMPATTHGEHDDRRVPPRRVVLAPVVRTSGRSRGAASGRVAKTELSPMKACRLSTFGNSTTHFFHSNRVKASTALTTVSIRNGTHFSSMPAEHGLWSSCCWTRHKPRAQRRQTRMTMDMVSFDGLWP